MKIVIAYPPVNTNKGTPLLSQNRQFQYFKEPTYIYPVVPAYAATLLDEAGFDVKWKDCIAENINEKDFFDFIRNENPDLIAIETKTPLVKLHWKIINEIKIQNPNIKIVLYGDHVTALPKESMEDSKVDFVLTGGDYDFLLVNLCSALKNRNSYENFEPGIFYRLDGEIKSSGKFVLNRNLDELPFINRDLTKWRLYAFKNGNFRTTPGTYIMAGRDCWWGKCKFCSWPTLYPEFRTRTPKNVLDEIDLLVNEYEVKEIMDDTGTFPVGKWLHEFCKGMIESGLNKKVALDCNMRLGILNFKEHNLMKEAGFRLVLFGLESANQKTLDKINKDLRVEEIIQSCKMAKSAGLYPHITIMFGYPWESYEEALNTLRLGRWLLKKGIAYTVQATIVIPYPGTPLFNECREQGLLSTLDWSDYDMENPVMKLSFSPDKLLKLVQSIYSVSFSPEFIARKIISIRGIDDIKYFGRAFAKVIGHIVDFKNNGN